MNWEGMEPSPSWPMPPSMTLSQIWPPTMDQSIPARFRFVTLTSAMNPRISTCLAWTSISASTFFRASYCLWVAAKIRLLVVRSGTTVGGYLPSWFGWSIAEAARTLPSCSAAASASMFCSL